MAFCEKCGTKADEGAKFCPSCGAVMEAPEQQAQSAEQAQPAKNTQGDFAGKLQNLNNTADTTADFDKADIQNNKIMAVLAYLGLLWLIPFFGCKQSRYAQYHCKQGLTLLLAEIAYTIISVVLSALIKTRHYVYGIYVGSYTPGWLSTVLWLVAIPIFVLAILGIINAASGKAKELPVIGKYKILK